MTISATTPMTTSSENTISNIESVVGQDSGAGKDRCDGLPDPSHATHSGMMLVFHFGIDGMSGLILVAQFGCIFLHPFLEPFDRPSQIAADITQFLGTKNQQHDYQNDQPVPNAKAAHGMSPLNLTFPDGIAPAKSVTLDAQHFLPPAAAGLHPCLDARAAPLPLGQPRRWPVSVPHP